MKKGNFIWHLLALITVFIWGTTFVSTKYLIMKGVGSVEIMVLRFIVAYVVLLAVYPKFGFAGKKEEFKFLLMGAAGGSIYFISENSALQYTLASNVALIVCMAPVLTAILAHFMTKDEKLKLPVIVGFLTAITGIALIVFNGKFILKLNPAGDFLALGSALSWAFYSIFLKNTGEKYNYIFITRKILFYSIITSIPFIIFSKERASFMKIFEPGVFLNIAFLGVVASALCYIIWHNCINKIGMVVSSNYIYLSPLITIISSNLIIGENITWLIAAGGALIIGGVFIAQRVVEKDCEIHG